MHRLIKNGSWIALLAGAVGCGSQLTGGSDGGGGHPAMGGAGGGAGASTGGAPDGGSNGGGSVGTGGTGGQVAWRDAAVDVANGCDEAVAARTIADLGLTVTSPPQTFDLTLPAGLTGGGWDLKATVCQQDGYDLLRLAGSSVCLFSQNITQQCQGYPAEVWVVMSGGTTACVYKTVASGTGVNPGVYAANDSLCK